MHCPKCHQTEAKVIDSRQLDEGMTIRRRRRCDNCEHRFTTYERVQRQMPMIEKNDGRLENYSREKILKGLKKACQKRPISLDQIEDLVDRLEKFLEERQRPQVSADLIGEFVMTSLNLLDPVSYVRFASFYWNYADVEGFVKTLKNAPKQKTTATERH